MPSRIFKPYITAAAVLLSFSISHWGLRADAEEPGDKSATGAKEQSGSDAEFDRANELEDAGKFKEALAVCDKLVESHPDSSVFFCMRGNMQIHLKHYNKAVADFTKSLELDPNHVASYIGRSCCYLELRKFDKAVSDCDSGLKIDGRAGLYCNRGEARYKERKYGGAIEDLSKAIEMQSNLGEAYYYRSLAYAKAGKKSEASADKEQYKKLSYRPRSNTQLKGNALAKP